MKNSAIYYFLLFLVFNISCNEIESHPPRDYSSDGGYALEIQQLENFYLTGLDLVVENLEMRFPTSFSRTPQLEEKLFLDIMNGENVLFQ